MTKRSTSKHISTITAVRADAWTDFLNAVAAAWQDFVFAKKNEIN